MTKKAKLLTALGIILITGGVVGRIYTDDFYNINSLDDATIQQYRNGDIEKGFRGRRYYNENGRGQFRNHCFFYELQE